MTTETTSKGTIKGTILRLLKFFHIRTVATTQTPKKEIINKVHTFSNAIEQKWVILGLIATLGLLSIVNLPLVDNQWYKWFRSWFDELLMAITIAMIVGIFIDSKFHDSHLTEITSKLSCELPPRIHKYLNETVGYVAHLEYLSTPEQVYDRIKEEMKNHVCFYNTIVDNDELEQEPGEERFNYVKEKFNLIINSNLIVEEILAPKASEFMKIVMDKFKKDDEILYNSLLALNKDEKYAIYEINVGELPAFINFCIFLKDPRKTREGKVMVGWFAAKKHLQYRHSCFITDHEDIVGAYAKYFEILKHSAPEKILSSYIAKTK